MGWSEALQLLAAGFLALGLAGYVLAHYGFLRPVWNGVKRIGILLEPAVLMVLTVAAVAVPVMPFFRGQELDEVGKGTSGPSIAIAFVILAVLIMTFYAVRNRTIFLFLLTGLPLVLFYGVLRWKSLPIIAEINATTDGILRQALEPSIKVSLFFPALSEAAPAVAAVLGGLYVSRRRWVPWKYLVGAFLGALAIGYLAQPFLFGGPQVLMLQALLLGVVARLMVTMPIARARLEALSGLRLSDTEAAPDTAAGGRAPVRVAATPFDWLFGHLALVFLILILVSSAMVNWSEREAMRMLFVKPRPVYRHESLRNAYTDLKRLYLKKCIPLYASGRLKDPHQRLHDIVAKGPDVRDNAFWEALNRTQLQEDLGQFEPYVSAYRVAAEKDYIEVATPSFTLHHLSFLPVREVSRNLGVQTLLAIRDGRTTEALGNIRSIIRFGALLKDGPNLVYQMIGVAVRGIGLDAAYQYYKFFRSEPEKLRDLARLLDEVAPLTRSGLSLEGLRRGEAFTLPISPWVEITWPSVVRAEKNTLMHILNFDALRAATALEIYRADQGRYPDRLEQLTPGYLRLVPVDPFKGASLEYQATASGFQLDSRNKPGKPFTEMFAFPPAALKAEATETTGTAGRGPR